VLEDVLNSRSTFQVVREHLLHVLAGAVYASSRTSYQGVSGLGVLWRKVKPAEEPDEVGHYPQYASLFDYFDVFVGRAILSGRCHDELPITPKHGK
jgi:hypothetical protein